MEKSRPDGSIFVLIAAFCHRSWPGPELAQMLIGERDAGKVSLMESAGYAFGCLQPAVLEEVISRTALIEVPPPSNLSFPWAADLLPPMLHQLKVLIVFSNVYLPCRLKANLKLRDSSI